ncbi:hypothetical protein GCM10023347_07700 [Streptomyces chumphonensis]|uniref:Conjugal transfer protein TraB n=1 Tax=Streptomyces chumphonensis TaxID=1214925 RepID=A0A927F3F8_9ACTN|nr:conjugal transfer protein TraB [Streptomyces chumphonensis]MBD3934840.1 conjugal transfer protein TraB [Streptomyces chumphonensis]
MAEAENDSTGAELELADRSADRDDLSFLTLAARFTRLAAGALRLSEAVAAGQRRAARNAEASHQLADLMAQAEVDPRHVAAMREIASQQQVTAEATGDMAGAATDLASDADAADSAHRAEYQDLYDEGQAMAAKGITQPKPGWFAT